MNAAQKSREVAEYWEDYPPLPDDPNSIFDQLKFATERFQWQAKFPGGWAPNPPKPPVVPAAPKPGAGLPAARLGDITNHGAQIGPVTTGVECRVMIEGKPAACVNDPQICKMSSGTKPHVGGSIVMGSSSVFIGNKLAARVSDATICSPEPGQIATGAATVLIGGFLAPSSLPSGTYQSTGDSAQKIIFFIDGVEGLAQLVGKTTHLGMVMPLVSIWVDMVQGAQNAYRGAKAAGILAGLWVIEGFINAGGREGKLRIDWREVWNHPDFQHRLSAMKYSYGNKNTKEKEMKKGLRDATEGVNRLMEYTEVVDDRQTGHRLRKEGKREDEIDDYMDSPEYQDHLQDTRKEVFRQKRKEVFDNVPSSKRPRRMKHNAYW